MHKEQTYPRIGVKRFFTCLAQLTLLTCFHFTYSQQLVFRSGFEGTVTGVPSISPKYLTRSDNLSSVPIST